MQDAREFSNLRVVVQVLHVNPPRRLEVGGRLREERRSCFDGLAPAHEQHARVRVALRGDERVVKQKRRLPRSGGAVEKTVAPARDGFPGVVQVGNLEKVHGLERAPDGIALHRGRTQDRATRKGAQK